MHLPLIEVEFEGASLKIDVSDFDALEWRALRVTAGLLARDVFDDIAAIDPYALAGLIWLLLRRDNPDVQFDDLAKRVTVAHAMVRDPDAKAVPPRRRRQLLAYLPSLAAVCNVRPWEVDLLTSAELAEFMGMIDQLTSNAEPAAKAARSRAKAVSDGRT